MHLSPHSSKTTDFNKQNNVALCKLIDRFNGTLLLTSTHVNSNSGFYSVISFALMLIDVLLFKANVRAMNCLPSSPEFLSKATSLFLVIFLKDKFYIIIIASGNLQVKCAWTSNSKCHRSLWLCYHTCFFPSLILLTRGTLLNHKEEEKKNNIAERCKWNDKNSYVRMCAFVPVCLLLWVQKQIMCAKHSQQNVINSRVERCDWKRSRDYCLLVSLHKLSYREGVCHSQC